MGLDKKRVMVTGAAGFIGSNLVDRLLEQRKTVIAYDNFDNYYEGKDRNIQEHMGDPCFKLVRADILNFEELSTAMRNVHTVFHMAAQPGVRFSSENPWKTTTTNINGTLNVLLAARKRDAKKVVFASSSSVYGFSQYLPWDEKHPTSPVSIYGTSKVAAEDFCTMFFRAFSLPVVILRYHTVFGPRQRPDMAIYKFAKALFQGQSPTVYGDGNQTRDFTYVSDVVEGTLLAAEFDESEGQVFNIGSGRRTSINEVVKMLKGLTGKDDISTIHVNQKLGDVQDTHANIRKARKMLGYKPRYSLRKGMTNFIRWLTCIDSSVNSSDRNKIGSSYGKDERA